MRKLPIFLYLATAAAAPSFAAMQDSDARAERRAERRAAQSERSDTPQPRAERPMRIERTERPMRAQRLQRIEEVSDGDRIERIRALRTGRDNGASEVREVDTVSGWRPRERRIRTLPETQPTVAEPAVTQPADSLRRIGETHRRRDVRDSDHRRWTHDWRGDRRYDWRRWRDRHRSLFSFGFYHDPFGWNYRRFNIGFNMWPSHYSSRFWMNDPWQYRLPPAYGPYRWVRYWDDAILVNIYTGQVEDVIHNFFW